MPQRLIRFEHHIELAKTTDVIEWLDKIAVPLRLLCIYPTHVLDHPGIDEDTIFGPAITPQFIQELTDAVASNGASPLAFYAWRRPPPAPFAFSEAVSRLGLRGSETWLIKLLKANGWADGVYVPSSGWMVVYLSKTALRGPALKDTTRYVLSGVAAMAGARLSKLKRRRLKTKSLVPLSKREQAVLRHLSQGHERADIERLLGLHKATVQKYVERLIKKLGARNQTQAAVIAVRERLI